MGTLIQNYFHNPELRLERRKRFYQKYGFTSNVEYGYGHSEIHFMEWIIERGALAPSCTGGSLWWSMVNLDMIYFSELAATFFEERKVDSFRIELEPVKAWLHYMRYPTVETWYQAHNKSIIYSYMQYVDLARRESKEEQLLINKVLARLLCAQVLAERKGDLLGKLGWYIANPEHSCIKWIIKVRALYPSCYPCLYERGNTGDLLTVIKKQLHFVLHTCIVKVIDELFIQRYLKELFIQASERMNLPELYQFVTDENHFLYPNIFVKND
ncbi:hypothetical protein GCM10023331_12810 [Algivirga pacifica]|uniref:Uncharacterized protein n=2 Tax=Algivirga pacifica TaxID=1162670 RepID=A0ABP9D4M6_9BACT